MEMFPNVKRISKRSFLCLYFTCAMFIVCVFYTFYTETYTQLSGNPVRDTSFETVNEKSTKPYLLNQKQSQSIPPLASYTSSHRNSSKNTQHSNDTTTSKTISLRHSKIETKYIFVTSSPSSSNTTAKLSTVLRTTPVLKVVDTCQMYTMRDPKVILLWTPFFQEWDYLLQKRINDCQRCRNCLITRDRTKLGESDAVVFHARDMSLSDLPTIRYPHQRWIFFCLESPPYSDFPGMEHMVNMFNWTMTYRSDSDIISQYGKFIRVRPSKKLDLQSLQWAFSNKTKSVVWMSSHCPTHGGRDDYVQELRKYIDVDVFGKCGDSVCPPGKTESCLQDFSSKYKFFLAFENTICKDYVTEKFFRTMEYNMIPVVFGGAPYSKLAPPASFIDALSFKSPKHLAFFLAGVGKDFKIWSTYFRWRQDYAIDMKNHRECDLCSLLHKNTKPSSYENFREWWVKSANCKTWEPKS
ncbi:alpha-(1,3)-fucosyltransferase C [Parasteatoda tepidariorum]|uniref:alpha-(1,3)-fucosyltransferase C n=1 Tax=Parasteatoda tepidariorum TaxID=114398 RepID=UPI001C71D68A|nr:alpha-(1,3)-fucosyltransferase C [Parasteatoda tepidariorum]XP_015930802.2 alpha-(1,3)-fucosyltransferase C [Parasteatoda tepidariorum]XP_015930803.2 alpha-(1,3)-fucosyltransferase C [Parasteatoda tepidariorum]XP_015930804.2 alpha-(1,3)-fucosyltransferase C [Parasteatoda tepidariorum]XP_015930805.2 alpha-(1,3)-fucosyltransferase C [Parasteatoda tepidariorum]